MNEEENDKKKTSFKDIINFIKTPRGRATMFFGFYLIFFIFVFSLLGGNGKKDDKPILLIDKLINAMTSIENSNYNFKYTITDNLHDYIYEGKKYNTKQEFTSYSDELSTKYQSLDNNYFKEVNNNYIKVDNPFYPTELFDIKEIKRIIKNSKLYSKTEYQSDEYDYTYQITLKDLLNLLEDEEIGDDNEGTLSIMIHWKKDVIEEIKIDASSYYNYLKNEDDTLNIILEYSDYGKIIDFNLSKVVE